MCRSFSQSATMRELIAGRLLWSPEVSCTPADFKGTFASIGDLVGEYRIPHYSREACGRAFGPLGLDETLKFCMHVQALLDKLAEDVESGTISKEEGVLSIGTSPKSINERTNAAVLMGAYLILFCNWKVDDVAAAMGHQDSSLLFICSWSRTELEESNRTLSVRNCWEGLQVALQQGWLDCVKGNEYAIQSFLQEYADINDAFDASWIIPSQLLVCADPVTTIYDPNPETMTELFPIDPENKTNTSMSGSDDSTGASSTSSTTSQSVSPVVPSSTSTASSAELARGQVAIGVPSSSQKLYEGMQQKVRAAQISGGPALCLEGDADDPPTRETFGKELTGNTPERESLSPKSALSFNSVETVNKEYMLWDSMRANVGNCHMDFVSFLRSNEARLIVRANYVKESGMPPPENCLVYDQKKFKSYGLRQVDVQFLDLNGAVPSPYHVHKMLKSCKHYMSGDGDAVVVHCKGGFGRSIVLAACLAIERFDVPGSALLGWLRLARPGCVNTIKQERFLASLRGRADVLSYAGCRGIFRMPACCGFS